jgi:hypothetical protein
MLVRTAILANSINDKADRILAVGRGINSSTDAVIQLNRTNDLARSILKTATPLQGKLDKVVGVAQSIDGLASSIDSTATAVNSTANGINSAAARILATARSIDSGVARINANLDVTIGVARLVKADTGNILQQAVAAHHYAAGIDCGASLGAACDGH